MFSLNPFQRRAAVAMLLTGFSTLSHALTFEAALRLAQAQAPQLKAREADVAAAQSNAVPAGELPDPKLALGIDNLPVSGPEAYSVSRDFMTMRRIGIMQEFPNSAKREARIAAAQSRVAVAEAQTRIARITILRETAMAWIARASVEAQLARLDALRAENRLLDAAVKAMLAGGRASLADAVMPRQEAAMIEERADALRARREQAIASLRRWIGDAAEQPLQGSAPDWPISREILTHRLPLHPELTEFDARQRLLAAETSEAQAEKKPDWALELAYQQRGARFSDMVSFQLRFDLPVFPHARQDPKIAAKRSEAARLEAEREAALREHAAMLESDLAEYQRLASAVKRQREVLQPLAEERVALATAAWRAGKGSLAEVVAARRERIETELRTIELDGQRQQVAARLYYAYGGHPGEQP